jgi:hypothetical protein
VVERQLQDSMSRMFPELLRFSSSSRLLAMVPEELQQAHRPNATAPVAALLAPFPSGRARLRNMQLTAPAQPVRSKQSFRSNEAQKARGKPERRHTKVTLEEQQHPEHAPGPAAQAPVDVWDGWADGADAESGAHTQFNVDDSDDDDLDLTAMGL